MEAPTVKSINMDKVNELLKVADPYLKNYVRALRDASSGWERLFHDSMKKVRELAAQSGTQAATVAAAERQPCNSRYATALEVLTAYRLECITDIYDYSAFRRYCAERLHAEKHRHDA
jgi:hypothetical protein